MKFSVGLDKNCSLIEEIIRFKEHIHEVYFSWGDFPNGRSNQLLKDGYTTWELQELQINALKELKEQNIDLNLLFNANCYGAESLSRTFFDKIGTTVDYVKDKFGLKSITTTSPLIAKFIKNNFEKLEVRASVNMEIGTVQGMEYLSNYFNGFYMKRELNRDFTAIRELSSWCKNNNKKLYMLANSGCLNYCSAHNFHDNLVAHENEIAKMDNAYGFTGICHEYLKNPDNYETLYENMNFIRPEEICRYEEFFDVVKLATRVHNNPTIVLESYIKGKYSGDLLRLLEPAHSIYPYVLENGEPPMLKKINTDVF